MALTAGQLIDDARNKHPAFNERDHPNKGLLREVVRLERYLLTRGIQRNPDYKAAVQTIALPLAVFADGAALTANIAVHNAELAGPNELRRWLDIVPWHARNDPRPYYCASIRDGRIYLLGVANDYSGLTSLLVTYTPVPTAIPSTVAGLAQALTIGDEAEQAMVTGLVVHMAGRGTPDKMMQAIPIGQFTRDHQEAVRDFELAVGGMRAGQVSRVREVW